MPDAGIWGQTSVVTFGKMKKKHNHLKYHINSSHFSPTKIA